MSVLLCWLEEQVFFYGNEAPCLCGTLCSYKSYKYILKRQFNNLNVHLVYHLAKIRSNNFNFSIFDTSLLNSIFVFKNIFETLCSSCTQFLGCSCWENIKPKLKKYIEFAPLGLKNCPFITLFSIKKRGNKIYFQVIGWIFLVHINHSSFESYVITQMVKKDGNFVQLSAGECAVPKKSKSP